MPIAPEEVDKKVSVSILNLHEFDQHALRHVLQRGTLDHVQAASGRFRCAVAQTRSSELRVDWGEYSLAILARGDLAHDLLTLGLIVAGDGEWRLFGTPAGEGDLLLMPAGGELHLRAPSDTQWLALQLPRHRLEALGMDLSSLDQGCAWHLPGRTSASLHAGLQRLAPQLSPGGLRDGSGAASLANLDRAHEELLALLLTELVHRLGVEVQPSLIGVGERWRIVQRAEQFIADHADLRIPIDELCQAAGTSVSRLERVFREVYGMGPQRYLSLRRLAAVRQQLRCGDAHLSVTAAATQWGFYHLGRFAADYQRLFGERPSETLATALGAGRAAGI